MKFTINQSAFFATINQVQRATATRIIQPILAHLLIEANPDNTIKLTATDLDLAIEAVVEAQVAEPGKTTISAKKLLEMVGKMPDGPVLLEADTNTGLSRLQSNNSVFDVRTLPAEEFPSLQKLPTTNAVQLPLGELRKAIQHTVFAAAGQETNNVLSGVYFKLNSTQLEMAATDGSRLARTIETLETPLTIENEVTAIIPARAFQEFLKVTQSDSAESQVAVILQDGQMAFQTERLYMQSRLLDGQYPKYEQLIPSDYTEVVYADREALIKSLERTAVMANERTNIVKMHFNKGELSLAAQTPDLGDSRDAMKVKYDGDQLDIAFNYKFVLDAIRVIDTPEVKLEVKSGLSPTLFKSAKEQDNYLCLVMPVQVK